MDTDALLDRVQNLDDPLAALTELADLGDLPALVEAGHLLAAAPPERLARAGRAPRPIRVAVTATFTAENVVPLLRVALVGAGLAPAIHLCPFDQTEGQLTDPDSELAAFGPDVTLCLLHDGAFLPAGWDPGDLPGLGAATRQRLGVLEGAVAAFLARTGGIVALHTVPLSRVEHRTMVSYQDKARLGRLWREFNGALLDLAETHPRVHVLDLETVLADHPARLRDERRHKYASMAWTTAVEQAYAGEAARLCRAAAGLASKCLVLDLDNTLWGGVVGDDGIAGIEVGPMYPGNCYTELQRRAKALRRQGVLLAIASKNEPAVVEETLATHPDLEVRAEDFAASQVTWEPKDASLRRIAADLNIDPASLVFADDSRFECDLVRASLPAVPVVRLDGDPAGHAEAVLDGGFFDVLSTTETDRDRTRMYRARVQRAGFAGTFASATDYLRGLDIRVRLRRADQFTLPRLAQLLLRTNQFTMTGRHPGEAGTREMAQSPDHLVFSVDVADRFGAEGVVGGVWVTRRPGFWLLENVVMSCRVFSRGIEHAVLQYVADAARAAGATRLDALFRPTDRNGPGAAFYRGAGFTAGDGDGRLVLPLEPAPTLMPDWITLEGLDE